MGLNVARGVHGDARARQADGVPPEVPWLIRVHLGEGVLAAPPRVHSGEVPARLADDPQGDPVAGPQQVPDRRGPAAHSSRVRVAQGDRGEGPLGADDLQEREVEDRVDGEDLEVQLVPGGAEAQWTLAPRIMWALVKT